jgi:hypothetical protein
VADSPDKDETVSPETAEDEALEDEETEDQEPEDEAGDQDTDAGSDRSPAIDELWQELRVDPIKVALPGGVVGFSLRAYRPTSQLTPTEAPPPEPDEDDPFAERDRQRALEDATLADLDGLPEEVEEVEEAEEAEEADEEAAEEREAEAQGEEEEEEEEEPADEEVPAFLSHRGKLLLFGTPESLVSFVNSDAPHDLAQLDTWPKVVKRVGPDDIAPADADTYELDLVVENLRGGHDAWDLQLLISAGEFARDVGYALRLEPVITALAAGSPLDDLDEAVRAAETGRFGRLFARRRLRRIGAQQASLGWRTVIGKISAAVDWRD